MKHSKLFLLFLFLSLKGLSQQAVLTSSGEKVILNFLSSSGGTITGTLGVTGNTTISGTLTTGNFIYSILVPATFKRSVNKSFKACFSFL